MSTKRARTIACLTAGAAVFFAAPPASADRTFRAELHDRFEASSVTIAQGERLTFENSDTDTHNLTAERPGSDGRPLFSTPDVTPMHSHDVEGVTALSPGSYKFECTIHPFMEGTLVVTSPPGRLELRLLSSSRKQVLRTGRVSVRTTSDAGGRIRLTGRVGRKLAARRVTSIAAGSHRVALKLTRAGRSILAHHKRVRIVVAGTLWSANGARRGSTSGVIGG